MIRRKIKIIPSLLLIYIVLGFIFPIMISVFAVNNRVDTDIISDKFINLSQGEVKGSFTAKNNFLNMIIISFKNPGLADKGNYEFSLKEGDNIIFTQPFSGFNIGDPSNLRFQFAPIPSSRGKDFSVFVKSISVGPSLISVEGKGDNLSFTSYYRSVNKVKSLSNVLLNLFSNFWRDWIFAIFWLVLIIGTILIWIK